jgi:septal ring factor EnvC (AmiA/AmiB activator)
MFTGPQKIVLIRAGRYDYAEVELSASLQIVGPNNTGKTTLINTLLFLYLDTLRKQDFGSYEIDESLAYYFPAQFSYVLFQCLGVTGQFVFGWRGQSKAAGGEPERFVYFGPYEADDFFNENHEVREPREVNSRLALKKFRLIRTAQEHRELLLPPVGADGKGLGIVALRQADRYRRFRESLKDLLSLNTINQEQMRERLLSLADVRTDIPALDVRRLFGDDYDRIRRLRDGVARFKKNEEQIRLLVERFEKLARIRGELITRWSDLRIKRTKFEQAHTKRLAELTATIAAQVKTIEAVAAELTARKAERDARLIDKGTLEGKLTEIEKQAKAFADFDAEFTGAARQNLQNEELRLKKLFGDAETESREKAQQKIALYGDMVRHKQQTISNFDRLAVTALRRHFSDDKLARVFRVLNFELLETPLGDDGITVSSEERVLALVRDLAARVNDGVYDDEFTHAVLQPARRSVSELENIKALREKLEEDAETLRRWETILKTITERERLAGDLKECQKQLAEVQRQIFGYEAFLKVRADEPSLRSEFRIIEETIAKLAHAITASEKKQKASEKIQGDTEAAVTAEENGFNQVMGRFVQCVFPESSAKATEVTDIPDDFDAAIALFLRQQAEEQRSEDKVTDSLKLVAQLVGESFNGADDAETVHNLAEELEALPIKTEALEHDWNALIQGLRGMFAGVLKELDAVRSATSDLNRQFARVQVSNLQALKLDVLESADLVSWIRRLVDLQQPGLFDDDTQLDQTLRNFRQKFENSPLISYAQLFSLQFTVVGEDGVTHHYQDFRQIESHGTTITIKVLFNLLVLRRYLREDQCVVPFFLDEIQLLDSANRSAVLTTARKLGFLAITAAPEAVSEVEALYFLQPRQGRIVLRQRHRIGVRFQSPVA